MASGPSVAPPTHRRIRRRTPPVNRGAARKAKLDIRDRIVEEHGGARLGAEYARELRVPDLAVAVHRGGDMNQRGAGRAGLHHDFEIAGADHANQHALACRRAGNQRDGARYSPTVIDRVDPAMTVVREETFGPVSPIITFRDIDDAIRISNGTAFGLSSGVCTNRMDDFARFADELQVGTVNLWEVPGYRIELTPFGGIKDSGLGYKEGVQEAIKSFTNCKTLSLPW